MSMTLLQIIMLNHAAWVNHERSEKRYQAKKEQEGQAGESVGGDGPEQAVFKGKKLSELTSEEMVAYMTSFR